MLVFVAIFALFIATNSNVEAHRRSYGDGGSYEDGAYNKKPSYSVGNEIYSPKKPYYSNNYAANGYVPRKPYNNYADEGYAPKKKGYPPKRYYDYGKKDYIYEPSSYGPRSYDSKEGYGKKEYGPKAFKYEAKTYVSDENYGKKYDIGYDDGYNANNYPKKHNYGSRISYEEPHRGYGNKPYGENNDGYGKSGDHYGHPNNGGYAQKSTKPGNYGERPNGRHYQNGEEYGKNNSGY